MCLPVNYNASRFATVVAFGLGVVFLLGSCTAIPRGAALKSEILAQNRATPDDFSVYPVTRDELPRIAAWNRQMFVPRPWISHTGTEAQTIQPGDQVNLVIWDSEANSLLTAPEQKSTALQNMVVGRDGHIFIPYVGRVDIGGKTPEQARLHIQSRMEDIAPSAQVQLAMVPGARQKVDMVGGVSSPGSYPLEDPDGQNSVLGLIAQAGGVSSTMNPQVSLIRSGQVYRTSLASLYDNPRLDAVVRGRDKLFVEDDDRYFRALGASGQEAIIPFDQEVVSALDAMAMMSGLSDARANPGNILILREYDTPLAGEGEPQHRRTIFTVDLTRADGLFSAGKFHIMPRDTVLVTEAATVSASTIIGIFSDALRISNSVQ
ncbi:MAG: polysaccharide export protein [Rhodobacteraceae bacterium]|nr:polysaccharide export protein [Paracoccaceae bacterium]